MTNPDNDRPKRIAEALEAGGITSPASEEMPNPFWAAQEAFYFCQGHRSAREWRELREWLTGPEFPRAEYYRKQAEYCRRALHRRDFPDELREPVCYAGGFLDGIAFALRKAEAGLEKP